MKGRLVTALLIALVVVAVSSFAAIATGTPAGTTITNKATLTYNDVNGNNKTPVPLEATVSTTVITTRGVDISPATIAAGTIEDKVTEYAFTIRNTGNANDTIALAVAGTNTDPGWIYEILVDGTTIGVWDETDTTITASTGSIAQDTNYYVIVRVTAPPTADYNGANTVTLTATGLASTDGGSAAAQDTGVITLDLSSANVTMAKTTLETAFVPLKNFDYTITVTNSDLQTAAYSVVMTDILDTDLAYVSSSATLGTAAEASGTVTWTIGTLPANTIATLTITVYVKDTTPQGDPITNTANLSYKDYDKNTYTDTANAPTGTTSELAGVNIATTYVSPTYVDPGDFIVVPFTITNTGNGDDTYDLLATDAGSLARTYTFYKDFNGDGILVAGVDFTDTNGDGFLSQGETILMSPITNTGLIKMDETFTFVAIASVPTTALYTDTSAVTVKATSTSDPANAYMSFTASSEVIAPVLTLVKSVLVNGAVSTTAIPTDTLTYTLIITNTGDGTAKTVVLNDVLPTEVTYVAGTLVVTPVPNTIAYVATDVSGTVTVTFGEIPAGAVITITFNVTVK